MRDSLLLLLDGKLMFAFWSMLGDDFHLANWMFADFPIDLDAFARLHMPELDGLARRLLESMEHNVSFKLNAGKRVGTFNLAKCRGVTDQSDATFAKYLGLTHVWEDIELLCSQIIKTDFDTDTDEEEQSS